MSGRAALALPAALQAREPLRAFDLPAHLEAREPPEARGLARDGVRMLVARRAAARLQDARFRDLPAVLEAGDLLVVNTSGTLPARLEARREDAEPLHLHLSTPVPGGTAGQWVVELRRGTGPFRGARAGESLALADGGRAELLAPYLPGRRLWIARLHLPAGVLGFLARHGRPIRYAHTAREPSLDEVQTIFASEPGSAEMPSAARPFTPGLVTALVARGVVLAPVLLHAGVSSLEHGESPFPERYRVPAVTARLVEATRAAGGRVIAVGTTVVRALETVAAEDGSMAAGEGWTRLVIGPGRGVRAVDGLLTGWHEPRSSHLRMLEAVAGAEVVERSYDEALRSGYLWHEFGDTHLLLP